MMPMRILLADDHAVLRAGLRALLDDQPDMVVVGEAGDGETCVDVVTRLRPDIVVLDINMPRCNGLEALERIRASVPETRVVVLTMHDDPEYLRRVMTTGGSGFILKQSAADELIDALRAVMEGGVYLNPRHTRLLLEETLDVQEPVDEQHERYRTLSKREAELFELTARGYSNADIADMLFLSVKTVETYKARMMRKLDLHSRAAVVRLALELELLQ